MRARTCVRHARRGRRGDASAMGDVSSERWGGDRRARAGEAAPSLGRGARRYGVAGGAVKRPSMDRRCDLQCSIDASNARRTVDASTM
eukprot:781201-Pyramimonas_sp.AAC.1